MNETARVIISWPKVPFVSGGTERLVRSLIHELQVRHIAVDELVLPLLDDNHRSVLESAILWRMIDLDLCDNSRADRIIATKFPSYHIRHPDKIIWLIHQYRQVYELLDTPLSTYHRDRPDDYQLIRQLVELDRQAFHEAKRVFAISKNVARRLKQYLGFDADVLYPPPPLLGAYQTIDYEPFLLVVQRLAGNKRTDLILKAVAHCHGQWKVIIVGSGPDRHVLEQMTKELGIERQVDFLGIVRDEQLLELYARCRAVVYVPYDEDYGFVPLEAFQSGKPVVTASDSGGTLEFVVHEENGLVAEPTPESLAVMLDQIMSDEHQAQKWGEAGREKVAQITWDSVIHNLVGDLL